MRWVSMTSWPTAEISAGDASRCSFSDETVSAVSSRSDDWRLIARSAWPTCVSVFCWLSTVAAFFSARSTSGSSRSSASCTRRGAAATSPLPFFRPRTLLREHVGAFLHLGERGRAADQRLRHRLREPLRLHQRLAGGGDLGRAAAGARRSTGSSGRPGRPGRRRTARAACAAARRPGGGRSPAGRRRRRRAGVGVLAGAVSVNSAASRTARPRR